MGAGGESRLFGVNSDGLNGVGVCLMYVSDWFDLIDHQLMLFFNDVVCYMLFY